MGDKLIGGQCAEDVAQESVLQLLVTDLPLKYSRNRSIYLVRDAFKDESRYITKTTRYNSKFRPKKNVLTSNIQLEEFFKCNRYPEVFKTIVGYLLEGFTFKEIGSKLGISTQLVHYYASKYRNKLKDHI